MPNYRKPQELSRKQYGSNWAEAQQVDHSYFFVEGPVIYYRDCAYKDCLTKWKPQGPGPSMSILESEQ